MYTHTRVYKCICIHIHRHTYIHIHSYTHAPIHAYMHTHIHTHACAHVCTNRKSQQHRLNVSSYIIDAHTHPYAYACMYTHIYIYTYVRNLQRVCSQMCTLVYKHTCVMYTPAHALVPKTPVKCMQHSLQKNARIYIPTHIYIRIHMHMNTHAHA